MSAATVESARAAFELEQAIRWLEPDPAERRLLRRALLAALLLHGAMLWARLPDWGPEPVRVEAPQQVMKVQFLRPPPPPKQAPVKPPEPEAKAIPIPDPTPDEPEPIPELATPPPPDLPVDASLPPAPLPIEPVSSGPIRVAPGQGPGLIKKVEPVYPPLARLARIQGTVVLDAVIQKDGSVAEIRVLSAANPLLEKPSVEALRQWRFTPGHQDVIMTLTVNFVLNR
jgi:protein TonB